MQPVTSTNIDSYFVYLKESVRLYQFVEEISANYSDGIEIEFVGGQYKAVILQCNVNMLLDKPLRRYIDSFFVLPFLSRIEQNVFEAAATSVLNSTLVNPPILQLQLLPSSYDVRENMKNSIPTFSRIVSMRTTNFTKSSSIPLLLSPF